MANDKVRCCAMICLWSACLLSLNMWFKPVSQRKIFLQVVSLRNILLVRHECSILHIYLCLQSELHHDKRASRLHCKWFSQVIKTIDNVIHDFILTPQSGLKFWFTNADIVIHYKQKCARTPGKTFEVTSWTPLNILLTAQQIQHAHLSISFCENRRR